MAAEGAAEGVGAAEAASSRASQKEQWQVNLPHVSLAGLGWWLMRPPTGVPYFLPRRNSACFRLPVQPAQTWRCLTDHQKGPVLPRVQESPAMREDGEKGASLIEDLSGTRSNEYALQRLNS